MKTQQATKEGAGTKSGDQKSGNKSDSENEDHVPVPLYRESFGDAISAALQSYTSSNSGKRLAIIYL